MVKIMEGVSSAEVPSTLGYKCSCHWCLILVLNNRYHSSYVKLAGKYPCKINVLIKKR